MTTKVLFLDIDGVINSERTRAAFNGYPQNFSQSDMVRFDQVAISLIRRVCKTTRCKIILSSSWRVYYRTEEVEEALDLPVIGVTPDLDGQARGFEINKWLSDHPEVTKYAIVDDTPDMLDSQKAFFVQTDPNDGLSFNDYLQLITILGTK